MNIMSIFTLLRNFFISFIIFLIVDMIWLIFIGKKMYQKQLGYLMAPSVNLLPAFLFYIIFVIGLMFFVIYPSIKQNNFLYAILAGGLYGLVTYSTYDLTNFATIRDWPVIITVIDLIWGSFVSCSTAIISFFVYRFFS